MTGPSIGLVFQCLLRRGAACALLVAAISGCTPSRPSSPYSDLPAWRALLADIQTIERSIGFDASKNFLEVSLDTEAFPWCGHAPRLSLPYSYEDPAIEWKAATTLQQCRELAGDLDWAFGSLEAMGEVGTPVTRSMLEASLPRLVYLVIHEDCHDQFDLPLGIEEPLCNLIAYRGMLAFGRARFGAGSREEIEIRAYVDQQVALASATNTYYTRMARLYARVQRRELSRDDALKERAKLFAEAGPALQRGHDDLNNIGLANQMTYSRHFPLIETVFEALGRDLARTVVFFRQVDRTKPARAAIMTREQIDDERSVAFIQVYEEAVLQTIRQALPRG